LFAERAVLARDGKTLREEAALQVFDGGTLGPERQRKLRIPENRSASNS
jgi:hypothetical protein